MPPWDFIPPAPWPSYSIIFGITKYQVQVIPRSRVDKTFVPARRNRIYSTVRHVYNQIFYYMVFQPKMIALIQSLNCKFCSVGSIENLILRRMNGLDFFNSFLIKSYGLSESEIFEWKNFDDGRKARNFIF
jgi:hypothetical protein